MEKKLLTLNPYEILDVSQAASKAEIVKAVTVAMKLKRHPVKVIAEAQKSLMDSRKRLLADYLRPIFSTIKPFEREDFSAVNKPAPVLTFLSDFDGLHGAIVRAVKEESRSKETPRLLKSGLLIAGVEAGKKESYQECIQLLEEFCQSVSDLQSKDYFKAQMWLIKADQASGQIEQAIARCKQLAYSENPAVQTWAKEKLESLSQPALSSQATQSSELLTQRQPQPAQQAAQMLEAGMEAGKKGRYQESIQLLEEFCQSSSDSNSKDYLKAQMWLVKAYQSNSQLSKAIALCQQLTNSENPQVQIWAQEKLQSLSVT
ncbi:MAG: hypothetical protein AB4426_14060 [Xenococcaceae cyanobacterium]